MAISEEAAPNEISDFINQQVGSGDDSGLESSIGQYGLAWMGNIILLFGITFLTQYIQNIRTDLMAAVIGFMSTAAVLGIAYWIRKSYSYLSFIFNLNAIFLLYYFILRLHFFSGTPLISNKAIVLSLLVLLLVALFSHSVRSRKGVFAGIAMVLATVTGIISDTTHFWLTLLALTSAVSVYLFFRNNWWQLLTFALFLVYFSFLIWIFNNPFISHSLEIITEHHYGFLYLFASGVVFTLVPFVKEKTIFPGNYIGSTIILNGVGFSFILLLFVLEFFSESYTGLFAFLMLYCLSYSVVIRLYSPWKFASAFYALFGFVAMSIVFYGLYNFPRAFWLLSLQSLLVVSMALWFRNRFIVLMNGLMFVFLIIFYIARPDHISSVNFSFAAVALVTARVLNWKKKRLEIKTEFLRNLYLVAGFVLVLYALYQAVPSKYITFSWTMAALVFFAVSLAIKNVKYRYMALATIISAAIYLFLVDLSRIEIAYRVLAFLFLAIISIGISVYYTKRIKKPEDQ